MVGLAVLAIIAGYIALWWFVITRARVRAERIAVVLIAVLIPFWDLPFGYLNFRTHCSNEGGTRVEKDLPHATAILMDQNVGYKPDEVLKFGFRSVEYQIGEKVVRYVSDGRQITKSDQATPTSTLKFQFSGYQKLNWNLVRTDYLVTNIQTGSVVARQTDFKWLGLWWQVKTAPLLGYGTYCLAESDEPLLQVLARNR